MRILVIEDEPRMSALLLKGLSEHGHDVTAALNGAEGLKCTLDERVRRDPARSRAARSEWIRCGASAAGKKYPASILMLTAYNKEDEIVRGLNLGADDYLVPSHFRFRSCWRGFAQLLVRPPKRRRPTVAIADMVVDQVQHKVKRQGPGNRPDPDRVPAAGSAGAEFSSRGFQRHT